MSLQRLTNNCKVPLILTKNTTLNEINRYNSIRQDQRNNLLETGSDRAMTVRPGGGGEKRLLKLNFYLDFSWMKLQVSYSIDKMWVQMSEMKNYNQSQPIKNRRALRMNWLNTNTIFSNWNDMEFSKEACEQDNTITHKEKSGN